MADKTENATSEVKDKAGDLKDKATSNGGGVMSSLLSKEVLIPALVTAGGVAAYAAAKGASGAKDKAEDEAENIGNRAVQGAKKGLGGGIAGMASKAIPGVGGSGGDGGGGGSAKKTRRLPIQRWTDIAAPIETVWDRWTDFEEFPNFMHRVLNVEKDENIVKWDEKIWFSKRHWEGEITERRKNEKIAWKTTSGMAHAGVITFHRMEKNLTRVMVDMDFVPQGMIEKMASGMRFVKRAVEADLARFKAYVEMGEAKDLEFSAKPGEREGDQKNEKDDQQDEQNEQDEENEASANGKEREKERSAA